MLHGTAESTWLMSVSLKKYSRLYYNITGWSRPLVLNCLVWPSSAANVGEEIDRSNINVQHNQSTTLTLKLPLYFSLLAQVISEFIGAKPPHGLVVSVLASWSKVSASLGMPLILNLTLKFPLNFFFNFYTNLISNEGHTVSLGWLFKRFIRRKFDEDLKSNPRSLSTRPRQWPILTEKFDNKWLKYYWKQCWVFNL